MPGLGTVTESYSYMVDEAAPSSPAGSVKILAYPVRWVVSGKREIHFDVHERPQCIGATAFTADQSFTITGGTGIYAGASGRGIADRALGQTEPGAAGLETWTGTLTVPNVEFDVAPPTISGARPTTVLAPRGLAKVRVRYRVTVSDTADGSVPVACKPHSGGLFVVGRRTTVRCTATDKSANATTRRFVVTVRQR